MAWLDGRMLLYLENSKEITVDPQYLSLLMRFNSGSSLGVPPLLHNYYMLQYRCHDAGIT